MENILILNLGTTYDLISSANTIGAIRAKNPNTKVDLLTFKQHEDLANSINGVSNIHLLDAELIQNIMASPLYSDAFAINIFADTISELKETVWTQVINYSNDNISSYFISALDAQEKSGTSINTRGVAVSSNKWTIYQNFVASRNQRLAINKLDIRNHVANLPSFSDTEKIKVNEEYSVIASQNFSRIRQMKGSPATLIVGINLAAGYDGLSLSTETLVDIIETLEDSKDFKPVLLLNGKNYQREMVNQLNKEFENKLISINIDTVALPSVLTNLDTIISASNDQLAVADLMDTKCIEVREFNPNGTNSILNSEGNFSLRVKEEKYIASDIILSLNEEFGSELPIDYMNSPNPIYQTVKDEYGIFLTQTRGDLDIQAEIDYHVQRSFFFNVMGYNKNQELIDHIKDSTDRDELLAYVTNLKSELTSSVKILLATLRSLKSMRNSESNMNSFINYLDTLIKSGRSMSLVGNIVKYFEGNIENIESDSIDSNIKSIENNLFELKANLQILTNLISEFADGKAIREEETTVPLNEVQS